MKLRLLAQGLGHFARPVAAGLQVQHAPDGVRKVLGASLEQACIHGLPALLGHANAKSIQCALACIRIRRQGNGPAQAAADGGVGHLPGLVLGCQGELKHGAADQRLKSCRLRWAVDLIECQCWHAAQIQLQQRFDTVLA